MVGGGVSSAIKTVALAAILGWVASGAESALKETAKVIDDTTSPQLTSSWFSASYWRVAGIAALLTVPFLCAAAIHALVRSDLGLLTRAAFGYLPLSLLAVGIASQLTMLLLAGTDEMSSIVASASLHADGVFLSTTSVTAVAESVATGDPFVTFLAAIITVAATLALWLELLVRNAAVYVIVLMLPLFFAAMVWPARRTLAIRAIETLIALILSKFAIVAVLSLGGSALGHSTTPGAASVLTGGTLVLLAAFTPWALLRMLPLHEVASAAAGGLSHAPKQALSSAADRALSFADGPPRSEPRGSDAGRFPTASRRSWEAAPAPSGGRPPTRGSELGAEPELGRAGRRGRRRAGHQRDVRGCSAPATRPDGDRRGRGSGARRRAGSEPLARRFGRRRSAAPAPTPARPAPGLRCSAYPERAGATIRALPSGNDLLDARQRAAVASGGADDEDPASARSDGPAIAGARTTAATDADAVGPRPADADAAERDRGPTSRRRRGCRTPPSSDSNASGEDA